MAKKPGKAFEDRVKSSAEDLGCDFQRFIDAGYSVDQDKEREDSDKRFTPSNICDCLVFYNGILTYIECKSYESSIPFSQTEKQRKRLKKKWKPESLVSCGFLCEFRNAGEVWFIPLCEFDRMKTFLVKQSFSAKDVVHYGIRVGEITPQGKRSPRLNVPKMIVDIFEKHVRGPYEKSQAANKEK